MKENQQTSTIREDKIMAFNVDELLTVCPELKDSMNEDGYYLQGEVCTDFKPIKDNDNVIGFITYLNVVEQEESINNYYVEKQYETKGYLVEEIRNKYEEGKRVTLVNPLRKQVEELLEHGLAEKITDRLVISAVNLDITPDKIQETKYTNSAYITGDTLISSTLYDLYTCSVVYLDDITSNRFAKSIYFSKVNRNDIMEYNAQKNRKNMDDTINHIKERFEDNPDEINERLMKLREKLHSKTYTLDEIKEKLAHDVDEKVITKKKAEKIEEQLIRELDEGKITEQSIYTRLVFLERYEETHPRELVDSQRKCYCRSCSQNISISQTYCYNCGHVINADEYGELLEYGSNCLIREILDAKYSLHDDFDFESDEYKEEVLNLKVLEALSYLYSDYTLDEVVEYIQIDAPEICVDEELLDMGYIKNKYNEREIDKYLKRNKKDSLKQIANYYNLKSSGSATTLLKRISKYYKTRIQQKGCYITPLGLGALALNQNVINALPLVNKFVFSELQELSEELDTEDNFILLEEFYDRHLERAWEQKNHDYYTYTLDKLSELYNAQRRYDEAGELEAQSFILHLNPYMMNPELIEVYSLENALLNTVKRLRLFKRVMEIDVEEKLECNWIILKMDENKIFVPLEDCKEILEHSTSLVESEEIQDYLIEVQKKYFADYM